MVFTRLFKRKNGQLINYLAVITFLFIFAFLSILGTLIYLQIQGAFTDAGLYVGQLKTAGDGFLAGFLAHDIIFVLVMVVLIIGIGLTSFRLNTHPAFFIITFIMGSFLGLVGFFFSHIFAQIVSINTFNTVVTLFPYTIILATNLHWVALVLIVIGSITLYAKKPTQGGDFVE